MRSAHRDAFRTGPDRLRGRCGRGRAVGTCGELVQGALDSRDLMVTFPVDWHSQAVARTSHLSGVRVWPASKAKAWRMCELVLDRLAGCSVGDVGIDVRISTSIPEGRGYASSSADLLATCRAMAERVGARLAARG